jgi:hypothetical protein
MDFHVHSRTARGTPLTWNSQCATCILNLKRLRKGHRPRPLGKAPLELARARAKIHYQRKISDPEYRSQIREYHRIYKEASRRLVGIPERRWGPRSKRGDHSDPMIAVGPLAAAVVAGDTTVSEIARRLRVDERGIKRQLGLVPESDGTVRRTLHYRAAVEIALAAGVPASEADSVIDPPLAA